MHSNYCSAERRNEKERNGKTINKPQRNFSMCMLIDFSLVFIRDSDICCGIQDTNIGEINCMYTVLLTLFSKTPVGNAVYYVRTLINLKSSIKMRANLWNVMLLNASNLLFDIFKWIFLLRSWWATFRQQIHVWTVLWKLSICRWWQQLAMPLVSVLCMTIL